MKGYDYLKKALDGELKPKTIIRTTHTMVESELNVKLHDYYIYENDNMFHRCNEQGKLGAKFQDRFLNYKVLEKDFEFYCVLEEEKKIPEKIKEDCFFDMVEQDGDLVKIPYLTKVDTLLIDKINEIITYLESKGE